MENDGLKKFLETVHTRSATTGEARHRMLSQKLLLRRIK